MKIALLILASTCLAQRCFYQPCHARLLPQNSPSQDTAHFKKPKHHSNGIQQVTKQSHDITKRQLLLRAVQEAINLAVRDIQPVVNKINAAVISGQELLNKYSDESTRFFEEFRINTVHEVRESVDVVKKAFDEATKTESSSPIRDCHTTHLEEIVQLGLHIIDELGKCPIAQIKQFSDMAVDLSNYGNESLNFVPNTLKAMENCADDLALIAVKVTCVARKSASATLKLGAILAGVTKTVATADLLMATFREQLALCAAEKLFSFRRQVVEVPVTIAACVSDKIIS